MVAYFEKVVAVSFAFPAAFLQDMVPVPMEIDAYEGWGFVTVAMVWTRHLRPADFPKFLGRNFFLAGYRIFTRLQDGNRKLRGLQILRSETDKRSMVWLGNWLTGYRYRQIHLQVANSPTTTRVQTILLDGTPTLDLTFCNEENPENVTLPQGSPFPDWRTARLFAGPMPFTFSAQGDGSFVVVEGGRQNWSPRPVQVKAWTVGLFQETPFRGIQPVLANAFAVEGISYRWEKGRLVRTGGVL